MNFARVCSSKLPVLVALLLSAVATSAQLTQPALAKIEGLRAAPEAAGTLVYRGETFAQRAPSGPALFRYERRVQSTPTGLVASHLTSDSTGRLLMAEQAVLSANYAVQRFEISNQQLGFSGSVAVSQNGHRLDYELIQDGKVSRSSETVSDPVVTGPSMFGFILKNWDALLAGSSLPVRMVALKEKTTYGFDIKFDKHANGQTHFTVTPSSFVIRLAVAPLKVVFDSSTRNAVRYEGRVPPMENVSGKLKDLDASVVYESVTPSYR